MYLAKVLCAYIERLKLRLCFKDFKLPLFRVVNSGSPMLQAKGYCQSRCWQYAWPKIFQAWPSNTTSTACAVPTCILAIMQPNSSDFSQGVGTLLENPEQGAESTSWVGSSEEDPTYVLLLQCNQLAVDIDNEIVNIHNYMKDKYKSKFPELASFVHDAVQYAKTLQIIKNEMDLTKVQLEEVLPQVNYPTRLPGSCVYISTFPKDRIHRMAKCHGVEPYILDSVYSSTDFFRRRMASCRWLSQRATCKPSLPPRSHWLT